MALGTGLQVRTTSRQSSSGSRKTERAQAGADGAAAAVPSFFVCPISLELMRDPVTLSTGMTYDRASIEKWLDIGHRTCPTTNQVLDSDDLIPNHTLRRLIQSWCDANRGCGVDRIPTPKSPVGADTVTVAHLLRGVSDAAQCAAALRKLRLVAEESERGRKCIADAPGAVRALAAAMRGDGRASDEHALGVIAALPLSDGDKRALSNPTTLATLASFLSAPGASPESKVHAVEVLHVLGDHDARQRVPIADAIVPGLVELLREDASHPRAVQSALRCLLSLALPRRVRVAAIEALAIPVLVDLLPTTEKRNKELAFALLEILANCAEGREAITNNSSALPMIVKSMLGVSHRATEHAVATLWVVLSYASNRTVISTALHAGAFTNLLMLLPSECSQRAKLKARECLKLLNDVWGSYTCRAADDSSGMATGAGLHRHMGHLRFSTELV